MPQHNWTLNGITLLNKRLYQIYKMMIHRCYNIQNKSFKDYGGRGIIICDEWLNDYLTFLDWAENEGGYREDLFLDRINNDLPYCPSNCRWVTNIFQQNHKRTSVKLLFRGEEYNSRELSYILQIPQSTVHYRKQNGLELYSPICKKDSNNLIDIGFDFRKRRERILLERDPRFDFRDSSFSTRKPAFKKK